VSSWFPRVTWPVALHSQIHNLLIVVNFTKAVIISCPDLKRNMEMLNNSIIRFAYRMHVLLLRCQYKLFLMTDCCKHTWIYRSAGSGLRNICRSEERIHFCTRTQFESLGGCQHTFTQRVIRLLNSSHENVDQLFIQSELLLHNQNYVLSLSVPNWL